MCGRFTLSSPGEVVAEVFELADTPSIAPRYNIAPTQPVLVVRLADPPTVPPMRGDESFVGSALADHFMDPRGPYGGPYASGPGRQLQMLRWGLIPRWAKDVSIGARMINARAETLSSKPAFRTAFRQRRCLVIADGFYEWQRLGRRKQPYYIHMSDRRPFAFAGLWEHWEGPDAAVIDSCTIITTGPNELTAPLHDRMPVILHPKDYAVWLDPAAEQSSALQPLLRPYPPDEMSAYPVSTRVNNPSTNTQECTEPLP